MERSKSGAILAAFGLALGAIFGMAGTMTAQPNLQATLWAIDSCGLVMACALLRTVRTISESRSVCVRRCDSGRRAS
jgi:hypothetical protein